MPNDHDDVDTYRFCPECGAQAAERAKFCGECGRSLIKEAAAQSVDQLPTTVEDPGQAPADSPSVGDTGTDATDPWAAAPFTGPDPSAEQQETEIAPLVLVPLMTAHVPTVEDPGQAPAVSPSVGDTGTDATDQWTTPFTGPDPSAEQQETETALLVPDVPAPVGVPPRGRHHRGVWSPETVAPPPAPPIPHLIRPRRPAHLCTSLPGKGGRKRTAHYRLSLGMSHFSLTYSRRQNRCSSRPEHCHRRHLMKSALTRTWSRLLTPSGPIRALHLSFRW